MCVTPKIVDNSYSSKSLEITDLIDNCDYLGWSCDHELLTSKNKQFRIVQFNIQGIRSKHYDLLDICDKLNDPEIIVLCETWLKPSDPCPNIHGYSFQGSGAWPYARLSLLKVYGKFNSNSNGADTAYICKHSACLHTQKCAHNLVIQITLKFHSE